jgi:hypothetical protein
MSLDLNLVISLWLASFVSVLCPFARGALEDFSESPVELEWLFVTMSAVDLHCRSLDINLMIPLWLASFVSVLCLFARGALGDFSEGQWRLKFCCRRKPLYTTNKPSMVF